MSSITFRDFELEALIQEQERRRFRLESSGFLRCFVSFADNDEMKLCFLMHHLGGDGKTLCYFIETFLKSLNGESCEYRKIVLLGRETLPQNFRMPFLASYIVGKYNRKWRKERRIFGFDDMSAAYEKFWKTHRTSVRNEVTGNAELTGKLNECKANKIGFTSYTIAEMIRDIPRVQDVGLAVDGKNIVGMVTVGDHLNTTYHRYIDD